MRFTFQHIPDESLLLSSTGELSRSELKRVLEHVSGCSTCAARLREISTVHGELHALHTSGHGFETTNTAPLFASTDRQRKNPVWRRWTAAAVMCAVVPTLVFFGDGFVVSARATTILLHASEAERNRTPVSAGYKISAAGKTCYVGNSAIAVKQESDSCGRVKQHLASANWNSETPLSAQAFERWRKSIGFHRDSVKLDSVGWTVRTEAKESPIKAATIRLNRGDYKPVEANLEFSDVTLRIEESKAPTSLILEANAESPIRPLVSAPEVRTIDPLDLEEANAWMALHEVEADSGWEVTVTRKPSGVVVQGIVSDNQRDAALREALKSIDGIRVEIATYADASAELQKILPVRLPPGASEPLANDWLVDHYPDADGRLKFRNDVREQSRYLLGRSLAVERLKVSLVDVSGCSECKRGLTSLLQNQETELQNELNRLGASVSPYFGKTHSEARSISYVDAERLDRALGDIFSGSNDGNEDIDADRQIVGSLLFRERSTR